MFTKENHNFYITKKKTPKKKQEESGTWEQANKLVSL